MSKSSALFDFLDHFLGVPGHKNKTNEVLLVEAVWNSENASVSENTVQIDKCKLWLDGSSSGDSGSQNSFTFITGYNQTGKTMNTRIISGMLFCCKKKANQA